MCIRDSPHSIGAVRIGSQKAPEKRGVSLWEGLLCGSLSVSYTHLDVYKRQALGFGLGLERALMILDAQKAELAQEEPCKVFIAALGEDCLLYTSSARRPFHRFV